MQEFMEEMKENNQGSNGDIVKPQSEEYLKEVIVNLFVFLVKISNYLSIKYKG